MKIARRRLSGFQRTGAPTIGFYIECTPVEKDRCLELGIHGYLERPLKEKQAKGVLAHFNGKDLPQGVELTIQEPGKMKRRIGKKPDKQPRKKRRT